MSIHQFLAFVGIIQGVFLFIAILSRGPNRLTNIFLSAISLIISIRLASAAFPRVFFLTIESQFWSLMDATLFLIGPLAWSFARELAGRPVKTRLYIHFLLAIFVALFVFVENPVARQFIIQTTSIAIYVHMGSYQIAMILNLRRFTHDAKDYVSNPEHVKMTWFIVILIGSALLILGNIAVDVLRMAGQEKEWHSIFDISLAIAYLFGITYVAIRYPESNLEIQEVRTQVANSLGLKEERYARNRLGENVEKSILHRIINYMNEHEPYRNQALKLSDLALKLGYTDHTISMVLNIHGHESFYQFVNRYRVEAAKADLTDPDRSKDSILTIAYESGFRSKSTFNTVFRELTGKTPSEYRSI